MSGDDRNALLEDRLVRLAGAVCRISGSLPRSTVGRHIAGQLVRCGTAPAANYAEARAAESRRDFVHKLGICLKELRETHVWLKTLAELRMGQASAVQSATAETDELVAIFVTSVATAKRNAERAPHNTRPTS